MSKPIFNKNISPSCAYCQNAKISNTLDIIFCKYKGPVFKENYCRKYKYDPLKRVPLKIAKLPDFKSEDFSL